MLAEIAGFNRAFDHVTGREAWQAAAQREAPAIAQATRREVCFFSAWDFHLPTEGDFQLIEFNDNGSGFLFAAIVNALFYEATGLARKKGIASPLRSRRFVKRSAGSSNVRRRHSLESALRGLSSSSMTRNRCRVANSEES
jgi:hypothetical protein